MPTILLKKSDTPGSVPGTANLTNLAGGAEVAVNTADKRMFSMTSASAVIELGTNPSSLTCADASFTVARVGSLTISSLSLSNATITSATITNLTATSLTLSNNPTFSGGTANGVLYLNGSKVATSGSTLTFDGTNLGVGTASPGAYRLNVQGGSSSFTYNAANQYAGEFYNNSATGYGLYVQGGGAAARAALNVLDYAGTSILYAGNGNNVGIGTASPAFKLDVETGAGRIQLRTGASTGGTSAGNGIASVNTANNALLDLNYRATQHAFISGASTSTAMLLDSSGNLGIGTASPGAKLHVLGSNLVGIFAGTNANTIYTEYRYNSTTVSGYIGNGSSILSAAADSDFIVRSEGALKFATNGNNFRAVIDSSGNLGLGTTSPAYRLDVERSGDGITAGIAGGTYGIRFDNGGTFSSGASTIHGVDSTLTGSYQQLNINGSVLTFQTNATERCRITAAGEFLVGTTTSAYTNAGRGVIEVNGSDQCLYGFRTGGTARGYLLHEGTNLYIDNSVSTGAIIFQTNAAERARIASDGQFQVSSSLAGSNLLSFTNSSATGYGISMSVNNDSSGTYRYFEGYSSSASAQRIAIYTNGDVKNTNGVFAAFSDAKLKKDIVDAGSQWSDIKALRVRKYKLKDDAEGVVQIGLIAQEVEQVSPGLVNESQDETRDEDGKIVLTGEVTKGVKYSILYMKAVKALQEAMTRIEQLEAKVAALESA